MYRFNLKNKQVQDIDGLKVVERGADYVVLSDDGSEAGRVKIAETVSYVRLDSKPNPEDFEGMGFARKPR